MLGNLQLLMQMGVIMLFAFIAASLASRFKQSVILGYIIVGALIGPYVSLNIFGIQYNGLVQDIGFVEYLSQLGLVLLLFFLGLEFSFTKLCKIKGPAALLALLNTGVDLFMGVVLGMALGWPLVDTIFLAGVVAMGSAAITGKSLMELNRFSNPETEVLLGMMVMEDFVSMIVLAVMGGLMMQAGSIGLGAESIPNLLLGIGVFFAFFAFLAAVVIPRTASYLSKIKSDELFVLFALGMVFLSAALAEASGVPAIIGAFFLGMVFSETNLVNKMNEKLAPLRDAFLAMFFVLFGMLINPDSFDQVIGIVLLAVPLVIVGDLIITSALAYLMGFTAKGAVALGSALCGRGAESLMYAHVGANATASIKSQLILPFAGAFCLILSALAPFLMRISDSISRFLAILTPDGLKFGGAVASRTLGKVVMPSPIKLFNRGRRMEICLIVHLIFAIIVILTNGLFQILATASALAMALLVYRVLRQDLRLVVRQTSYENLGLVRGDGSQIADFTAKVITLGLIAMVSMAFLWRYSWWLALLPLFFYPLFLSVLSLRLRPILLNRPSLGVNGRGRQ